MTRSENKAGEAGRHGEGGFRQLKPDVELSTEECGWRGGGSDRGDRVARRGEGKVRSRSEPEGGVWGRSRRKVNGRG